MYIVTVITIITTWHFICALWPRQRYQPFALQRWSVPQGRNLIEQQQKQLWHWKANRLYNPGWNFQNNQDLFNAPDQINNSRWYPNGPTVNRMPFQRQNWSPYPIQSQPSQITPTAKAWIAPTLSISPKISYPTQNVPDSIPSPSYPRPNRVPPNIPFIAGSGIQPSSCGYGGKATYYTEWSSNPGSCQYVPAFDNLVALAPIYMPHSCGKCVIIHYKGKNVKAVVTDTCMACSSNTKWIDLSHLLFSRLDSMERGVLQIDWEFVEC